MKGEVQTLNLDSKTDTATEKNEITNLTTDFVGAIDPDPDVDPTPALTINITGDKELKIASPVLPSNAVQGVTFNAVAFTAKLDITGTDQDDTFTGGSVDNIFVGRSGNNTFTAGAGKNNFTGGKDKDTFTFAFDKFNTSATDIDKVDGGDGIDTLRFTGTTINATTPAALAAINGVEKVEVLGFGKQNNVVSEVTVDATKITAVKEYDFVADTVNLSGAATANKFTLNKTNNNNVALNLTGKGQSVDLTLKGKVKTLNLDSRTDTATEKNEITNLTTDDTGAINPNTPALTINITGGGELKIASPVLPSNAVQGVTFNAGAFTAKLDITGTDQDDTFTGGTLDNIFIGRSGNNTFTAGDGKNNFTGGKDKDTFIFAFDNFDADDKVDGGDGKDTLRLTRTGTIDATTPAALAAINGVEKVEVLGFNATTVTVDATKITAVKEYDFVADTVNLSGAATANKFTLNKT
ncbi:MAG: hypothetical protein ACKPH3_13845, partial [Dolichospermum sp.]